MDPDLHRVHAEMDERHWWFRARRRIIAAVLRAHVTPGAGVALDVGCGAGGLLDVLAPYGRVIGIEGEPTAADAAASRHPDADVRTGRLPEALHGLPACRLVTAFDVVEHVDDDVGLLSAMGRLASGGHVCVTVPAMPLLWSSHDEANGHRRRYTAKTMRSALEEAGLHVVHLSYFNTLLFPLVLVARLLERVQGPAAANDFDRSDGRFAPLLEAVFSLERFVVPRFRLPFGVSLVAVAVVR